MGYFSNLDIDEQEHNAHVQDQEPDMKAYMESEEFSKEFDEAFGNPMQQIDDIIASLGVRHATEL
jgi:hypothetical protein